MSFLLWPAVLVSLKSKRCEVAPSSPPSALVGPGSTQTVEQGGGPPFWPSRAPAPLTFPASASALYPCVSHLPCPRCPLSLPNSSRFEAQLSCHLLPVAFSALPGSVSFFLFFSQRLFLMSLLLLVVCTLVTWLHGWLSNDAASSYRTERMTCPSSCPLTSCCPWHMQALNTCLLN